MSVSKEELISRINDIYESIEQIDEKISSLEEEKSRLYIEVTDLESKFESLDYSDEDIYDQELW